MSSKLPQVIEILKQQGLNDDQIAQFLQELTLANFTKLYTEAQVYFTDEDKSEIALCSNQDEANKVIKDKFEEYTGKDIDIELQKFLETFCEGFLQDYQRQLSQIPQL